MPPLTTHHSPYTEFLAFAHQLADAAGAVIRPYFGAHGEVEAKGDASPVTIADRAAEQTMRALIATRYPGHAIYGEEFGQTVESRQSSDVRKNAATWSSPQTTHHSPLTTHDYTWVLDPIDGTRAFIAGKKEWGTLIALCEDGVPILGILDQPVTGERWVGVRGAPTRYFPSPVGGGSGWGRNEAKTLPNYAPLPTSSLPVEECHTRPCATLAEAEISSTSKHYFTPPQAARFVKLAEQCARVIEDGDCYAYGLLARGARDFVVDAGLKPYDILALVPIVQGAGGLITNWEGGELSLSQCDQAVASGDARCHDAALNILMQTI